MFEHILQQRNTALNLPSVTKRQRSHRREKETNLDIEVSGLDVAEQPLGWLM